MFYVETHTVIYYFRSRSKHMLQLPSLYSTDRRGTWSSGLCVY